MASRTAAAQEVQDAIRAGEGDFITSFQRLCSIASSNQNPHWPTLEASLLRKLASHSPRRISPWAYLGYFLIGNHLISDMEAALPPIDFIESELSRPDVGINIASYGDTERAPQEMWQHMLQHFQQGGDFISGLEAPERELEGQYRETIQESRNLIKEVDPELGELMDQLQSLLILAQPDLKARLANQRFGGATCFFFRGASVIEASQPSRLDRMTEQLVHEHAHAELFTLGQNEPLCRNSDDERHTVLIRADPRPMNGILHSLYVVARVAEWLHSLLKQKPAKAIDKDLEWPAWERLLSQQQQYGASSLKTIQKYAQLTRMGKRILQLSETRLALSNAK